MADSKPEEGKEAAITSDQSEALKLRKVRHKIQDNLLADM